MDNQKTKQWGKVALQLLIAIVAIAFVAKQIDVSVFLEMIQSADPAWLVCGFLAFNASKILSAFRLNHYFRALGLKLSETFNLKLYYLGMLYNQFLPGGIGGDGYKVYLLSKQFDKPIKLLIAATLLDRISGVIALSVLALALGFLGAGRQVMGDMAFLLWLGMILIYPFFYLFVKYVFPTFRAVMHVTNIQAIGVQLLQLVCALCILYAIDIDQGFVDYLALFLVTSVAASLPISLPGGIGIREAIFAFGYIYFEIDQTSAVALASLFFIITLTSSVTGIAFVNLSRQN